MRASTKAFAAAAVLTGGVFAASALAETRTYDLTGFNSIEVATGLSVKYAAGATYFVSAEFERGGPDDVVVEVQGDTLDIRRKRTGFMTGDRVRAVFTVTSPELTDVEVSSGSTFRGEGIDAEAFTLDLSSGASATLSGRCGDLELDVSSGGSVDAEDLRCATGVIDASSGASVRAYLSEQVSVDASSGASIRVEGGPEVLDVDKSSGASVRIDERAL